MKTNTLIIVATVIGLAGVASAEERKRPVRPDNRVENPEGKERPDGPRHPDRPLPREIIEKFDKDGDGKLNEDERAAAKEAMKGREEEFKKKMLEKFDKDGNGELSEEEKEEMKKAMWKERAKQFDKDGDGELNEEEKEAMKKAMKEHENRGGPGGPDKKRDHKDGDHKDGDHKDGENKKEAPGVLGE